MRTLFFSIRHGEPAVRGNQASPYSFLTLHRFNSAQFQFTRKQRTKQLQNNRLHTTPMLSLITQWPFEHLPKSVRLVVSKRCMLVRGTSGYWPIGDSRSCPWVRFLNCRDLEPLGVTKMRSPSKPETLHGFIFGPDATPFREVSTGAYASSVC